jgi:MFS transporter, ACS family, hexuronate transporter
MMKANQSKYRWKIVGLLFFATTLNYLDRQVLGILKPFISDELNWTELDYGKIVMVFQIAYGLGLVLTGAFLDKLGTKVGYGVAVGIWSVACAGHAFAKSIFGFGAARAFLGLGEAANFPAAIKSVSEWFPKNERAFATGWFNSGSNVGAFLAPIIVTAVTVNFGWQMAFVVTGALGFIWLILWWTMYEIPQRHAKVSEAELGHILQDHESEEKVKTSWFKLLADRKAQAICIVKIMTDWVWWFMLFWTPDFLEKMFGVKIAELVLPLIVIYTFASFGGIMGGWMSSYWIKIGKSIDFSRKTTMLIAAFVMLLIAVVPMSTNLWITVGLLSVACAAHQGWSANVFTLASDIFPKSMVGSVVSLAGFLSAMGGAVSGYAIGSILEYTHSYMLVFATAGSMYLISWSLLKVLVPVIGAEAK